jgi:hypothetical protein
MSQNIYTPGVQNAPYGSSKTNPQAANYTADSIYSSTGLNLIQKAIHEAIFDAAPEQYKALRLVFEKGIEDVPLDEFEFLEKTFGRTAAESTAIVAAEAASPGNEVTQVIAMTTDSVTRIAVNDVVTYPDGTKGIVRLISTLNVTIASMSNLGLPAVAVGDIFSILGPLYADGQSDFSHYERMQTVTRYNYIQQFLRAERWTRVELLKYKNAGTTNYLDLAKKEKMNQLRVDLFVAYFNGTRGEFKLANGTPAKTMGGIFPSMIAAGSMSGNPTIAGLPSQFETLALKTNFKAEGGTRFIYGTQEMLYALSKSFKQEGLRYEPNSRIADLNLMQYNIGDGKYVPVSCELFKEPSCFPTSWARRILVLDQEAIQPIKMMGLPALESGDTLDKGTNGTREGFKDFWVGANLSQKFNNPQGSFYLDVQ